MSISEGAEVAKTTNNLVALRASLPPQHNGETHAKNTDVLYIYKARPEKLYTSLSKRKKKTCNLFITQLFKAPVEEAIIETLKIKFVGARYSYMKLTETI